MKFLFFIVSVIAFFSAVYSYAIDCGDGLNSEKCYYMKSNKYGIDVFAVHSDEMNHLHLQKRSASKYWASFKKDNNAVQISLNSETPIFLHHDLMEKLLVKCWLGYEQVCSDGLLKILQHIPTPLSQLDDDIQLPHVFLHEDKNKSWSMHILDSISYQTEQQEKAFFRVTLGKEIVDEIWQLLRDSEPDIIMKIYLNDFPEEMFPRKAINSFHEICNEKNPCRFDKLPIKGFLGRQAYHPENSVTCKVEPWIILFHKKFEISMKKCNIPQKEFSFKPMRHYIVEGFNVGSDDVNEELRHVLDQISDQNKLHKGNVLIIGQADSYQQNVGNNPKHAKARATSIYNILKEKYPTNQFTLGWCNDINFKGVELFFLNDDKVHSYALCQDIKLMSLP